MRPNHLSTSLTALLGAHDRLHEAHRVGDGGVDEGPRCRRCPVHVRADALGGAAHERLHSTRKYDRQRGRQSGNMEVMEVGGDPTVRLVSGTQFVLETDRMQEWRLSIIAGPGNSSDMRLLGNLHLPHLTP